MEITIRKCKESDINQIENIFKEFVAFHAAIDASFIKVEHHKELFLLDDK